MMTTAKRGDLVLVEYRPDAMGTQHPNTFALERVTSVARDGSTRRTSRVAYMTEGDEELFRIQTSHGRPFRHYRCYYVNHMLVPAAQVDAAALWAAWLARQPEGGWRPEPLKSIDDAKAFCEPFRRAS